MKVLLCRFSLNGHSQMFGPRPNICEENYTSLAGRSFLFPFKWTFYPMHKVHTTLHRFSKLISCHSQWPPTLLHNYPALFPIQCFATGVLV